MKVITFDYGSNCLCLWNFISNATTLSHTIMFYFLLRWRTHTPWYTHAGKELSAAPRRTGQPPPPPTRDPLRRRTHDTEQMIHINILSAAARPSLLLLGYRQQAARRVGTAVCPKRPPTHTPLNHQGGEERAGGGKGSGRRESVGTEVIIQGKENVAIK